MQQRNFPLWQINHRLFLWFREQALTNNPSHQAQPSIPTAKALDAKRRAPNSRQRRKA